MKDGFWSVFSTLFFNNRLEQYQAYIKYAKNKGYEIVSLEEFFKLPKRRNGKYLVLRHDVDYPGLNVRKMFEVEKSLGVKSSYYFRFSSLDVELAKEMIDNGYDVGLHFETISDYIKETGCSNKKEIDLELMALRLKQEIVKFEKLISHKTFSCCSHGAPENIKMGISNNAITEGREMKELGIAFEAYSKELYEDVDCHIMDQSILRNFGFSYADTPISAVDHGFNNIIFLSHPAHWYFTFR